jgi:predicted transposase YdaD
MRFKEMIETGKTGQVSQEELKNLQDLRDTREEVLRDLGREDMARQIAQKMLELGEPVEKIASITGLSVEEIRKPS